MLPVSCDGERKADEYWMSAETSWICDIERGRRDKWWTTSERNCGLFLFGGGLFGTLGAIGRLVVVPGEFELVICLLYTSPSPRDRTRSRMPSSA